MSRANTRAGSARRASCPPFNVKRCFLTVFISAISAPDRSSSPDVSCNSFKVIPSGQSAIRADAPPENRQMTRSFRSEEHTSELQSLMLISYAVFCLKKKTKHNITRTSLTINQHDH